MEYTPLPRRKNAEIGSMSPPEGGWKCRNVNNEARIKSSRFLSRSTPQITKTSKLSMNCRCSKTPPRLWNHSPGAQVLFNTLHSAHSACPKLVNCPQKTATILAETSSSVNIVYTPDQELLQAFFPNAHPKKKSPNTSEVATFLKPLGDSF